jgi:hypothetical protein
MRYSILAVALMATSAAAQDGGSSWQFAHAGNQDDGPLVAFVNASDGNTLAFKCDKPGKRSVYAAISTEERIGNPSPIPSSRTVTYRFDDGSPQKDNWRYFERIAVAFNTSRDAPIVRFIQRMGNAKQVEIRLEPLNGSPITMTFDVAGAPDALPKVFESCKDSYPS